MCSTSFFRKSGMCLSPTTGHVICTLYHEDD
jgi:hypothetical protein